MTNSSNNNNSSPTSSSRLIPSITSQTFRVVTQYGDLLVVRQGAPPPNHGSHAPRHRHRQHSVGSGLPGGGYSHESSSESPLARQSAETSAHGQGQPSAGTQAQYQSQQQQYDSYLTSRPYILTFHDLGLNHELQFAKFCETDEVKLLLQTFTMVHVNFPGQEFDANDFEQTDRFDSNSTINSHDFYDTSHNETSNSTTNNNNNNNNNNNKQNQADELTSHHQTMISTSGNNLKSMAINYPSIEQMAEAIVDICAQLKIRSFIALAVGAGAYVVSLCALTRPQLVDGLFLINPTAHNATITEWLYFKMSAIALYSKNRSLKHSSHNLTGSEKSTPPLSLSGTSTTINSGASTPCKSFEHASDSASLTSVASNQSLVSTSVTNSPALIKESVGSGGGATGSASGSGSGSSGGSRLRRLILSRNFKMAGGKSAATAAPATGISTQKPEQSDTFGKPGLASSTHTAESAPASRRSSICASVANSLIEDPTACVQQQLSIKQTSAIGGRAPVEYLMYHHFGITSMQSRVRRNSDHSHAAAESQTQSVSISGYQQQASGQSNTGSNIDTMLSASTGSPKGSTLALSSSLSATHLASLTSERERHVFIQNAYRQHFNRLNAHNLWLFVQSFARRKSLNLRKDCGVAAHAAAAAASLSTSICAAFVGIGSSGAALAAPSSTTSNSSATTTTSLASIAAAAMQRKHHTSSKGVTSSTSSASSSQTTQNQSADSNKDDSVQIAGTKVKRTFACQTLIMTSSVQVHCERAFKLMSLLHPLRATCIKTDCELVLEEQPEKVCKALRLFLQGIGFSMSTFERRLRLSSATGSASSADSATSLSHQSSQYHQN